MSFSSDIKEHLNALQEKHSCCQDAFQCGLNEKEFNEVCEKDVACFLRGVFVKSGFVSQPRKNYELAITFSDDYIFYVNAVLDNIGLEAKIGKRKNKHILYYKESEKIEDFLAYIGASKFSLKLMELKVIKELRGNVNRICNAETANLDRTAKAAAEQCEAISVIIEKNEYAKLPPELKECADLRIAHPDMSLSKLSKLFDEPISKSGLNHRLKKLVQIADRIRD